MSSETLNASNQRDDNEIVEDASDVIAIER